MRTFSELKLAIVAGQDPSTDPKQVQRLLKGTKRDIEDPTCGLTSEERAQLASEHAVAVDKAIQNFSAVLRH